MDIELPPLIEDSFELPKFKDDIFRRGEVVPNSKNHGLVMFIDWSGSMSDVITSVMEQIVIFVLFCKKAGIKFQVLAFSDNYSGQKTIYKNLQASNTYLTFGGFRLLELFNSNMTAGEFGNALFNATAIAKGCGSYGKVPENYTLGGTPLNGCIASASDCIRDFKKKNNIEIINTIFLTDGGSNWGINIRKNGNNVQYGDLFVNGVSGYQKMNTDSYSMTEDLLKRLQDEIDSNVLGFFLTKHSRSKSNDGYKVEDDTRGYNKFFTINANNFGSGRMHLTKKDYDELLVEMKENQRNMKSQRQFVRSFIELIA